MAFFSSLSSKSLLSGFRLDVYAKITFIYILLSFTMPVAANRPIPNDYTTAESGNPFVNGWYADPDTEIYDDLFWVYPTSSYGYDEQTYLDAFSSSDLINWTKYPNVLTTDNVTWATRALWAPAPIFRDGKYYLYFAANDIQEGEPEEGKIGGIGVAVSDKPEGPYVDAIGKPLIGEYHNGAQPIDQDVFIDDVDGQAYIYYGGHSHANVAKLNQDMISIGTFDDGTQFKEITPDNYVEGSQMLKRNGTYYLMWSEGDWTGPDYSVSYAMSNSPIGPFNKIAKILQQDEAVAKSSGHNGVINVPNTDIWYIVYHRRSLSETDGNHRVLAYDRMYFNKDGTIEPIEMMVKDNFANGQMFNWKTSGGDWSVVNQRLNVAQSEKALAALDTNFSDLSFSATVSITEGTGNAGLIFRTTSLESGAYGYYAAISTEGKVILRKNDEGTWTQLGQADILFSYGQEYPLKVRAIGNEIRVYVEDGYGPRITVEDDSFTHGATGLGSFNTSAVFGFVFAGKSYN
ncbi:carbohydrate-binding module family 66 protein [Annulohypoxylon maeteangense]|uniref:carbohydrate-binding module family 66 protein n=1 Tax=Annulohypoxylon maeteangense TaxID=1927788 RepID=UPI002007215E|nr:carbohydrate-binding module family 66 protein [Annulohypoxylon maeteangense]KAI0890149.1 carbohydrate-binding module family 66 protein [Annulohypoxylon maeteangense]